MKELLTLTKMFADAGAGWSTKGDSDKKKHTNKVIAAFLVLVALPFGFTMGLLTYYMALILKDHFAIGLPLQLGMIISCLFMFFFGLIMIPSTFYFSEDIEALLSMPIKMHNVFLAKLINTYVWENLAAVFTFIPVMIGFSLAVPVGWQFWIGGLIVCIFMSVLPVSYGIITTILIVRFSSFGKNKTLTTYLSSLISVLASTIISVYLIIQMVTGDDILINLILSSYRIVGFFAKLFPIILTSGPLFMLGEGVVNLFIFVGFNCFIIVLCAFVAKLFYHQGLMRLSNGNHMHLNVTDAWIRKKTKDGDAFWAIVRKDIVTLFTNPAYFSGCIVPCIIIPLIIFSLSRTGIKEMIAIYMDKTPVILSALYCYITIIILAFATSGLNYIAPTSISREGSDYQAMKYYPVSFQEQVSAKITVGIICSATSFVVSVLSLNCLISLPIRSVIFGSVFGFAIIYVLNVLGVWLDIYNPTVVWLDEQKAVKQNFNGMVIIVLSIVLATIISLISLKYLYAAYRLAIFGAFICFFIGLLIAIHLEKHLFDYFKKI